MNRLFTLLRRWVSLSMAFSLAFSLLILQTSAASATGLLFTAVGGVTPAGDDPAVIRSRRVIVNFEVMEKARYPIPYDAATAGHLTLNLFDDAIFNAVMDRVELNRNGSYTWVGHLETVAYSHVFLVVYENVLVGKISTPTTVYQVAYSGDGVHTITQFDPTHFPDEAQPLVAPAAEPPTYPAAPSAAGDGAVIDLLVLYTAAASSAAGGDSVLENEILLAVAETNQVYLNSGITQRLDLVHTAKAAGYIEAGNIYTDLLRLTNTSDGYIDEAHTLRNTYHADLVALVVQTGGCGIAWLNSSAASAFSVFSRDCMRTNLTLPHETGHNMYARHDWYMDATLNSPYSYSKGYVNTTARWRTVMAYNDHCAALGFSCARIPYFSNPNVTYGGSPTGVPIGTNTSCTVGNPANPPCDADNRTALNNTAATMDGFRNSENRWQGNTSNWNETSNWSLGYIPRAIDDIVIPAAPSGGQFPILSADASAREVIIESGATLTLNGGVLSVYGHWENHGAVNVTGGTVQFKGILEKTITSGGSAFHHLIIGDGVSTSKVTLNDDLDVNGDLTIQNGASLYGGNHTLAIGGNWTDNGSSFVPETSTVIFDGSAQGVDKPTTTAIVLNEPFEEGDGKGCCSSAYLPTGWIREQASGTGWLGGEYGDTTGAAFRWNDSPDAWLFTTRLSLNADARYQISFSYRVLFSGATENFSLYLGTAPTSSSMTQLISSAASSSTTYATRSDTFSVAASGDYYLGIRAQQASGTGYAVVDNILLTGTLNPTFYNVQVNNPAQVTLHKDTAVKNNLTIHAGGTLDLNTYAITVNGALSNTGTLRQTKTVASGSTTEFLRITNNAGTTTQYYGVDITPAGAGLGVTTVSIRGNQTACTTQGSDMLLSRCYAITPGSAQNATLKFWYTEAERNGQAANALKLWHYDGPPGQWSLVGDTYQYSESETSCASGGGQACWFQAANVTAYSPFGVGSGGQPNALKLTQSPTRQHAWPVYPLLVFASVIVIYMTRRKRAAAH